MSAAFIGESQLGVCLQLSSGKANWAVTAPSCKQPYGRTEGTIQASFDHTLRFKWVRSTPVQSIIFFHDKQVQLTCHLHVPYNQQLSNLKHHVYKR